MITQEEKLEPAAVTDPRLLSTAPGVPSDFLIRCAQAEADCQCYCRRLGSLNDDLRSGYHTPEGLPRAGDDGCEWYQKWLANVDAAVAAGVMMHVIQKVDGPKEYWTNGVPLGHAQCLEVLTLAHRGLEYQSHPTPAAFREWLAAQPSEAEALLPPLISMRSSAARAKAAIIRAALNVICFIVVMLLVQVTWSMHRPDDAPYF